MCHVTLDALDAFMGIFDLTRVPNDPELKPANADRAQLAALGATPLEAIAVTVRRPEPAAGHFTD
jgi:hypothetical protein